MARRKKSSKGQGELPLGAGHVEPVSLHEATRERYLNYALSVITSRALPDVRDGMKPVQRRILYRMGQMGLRSDAKHQKCAKVVGDVMGIYHPHGDSAIYDALVRMSQPFSMRMPLVDGSGNFGSLDGDPAAAMRYTECRMTAPAQEVLREIGEDTVAFRATYDGGTEEPVVLPARLPNLLINGSLGIAVGMATNIPPHNPVEVLGALVRLLDDGELSTAQLLRSIKGPDFPTGGQIISGRDAIRSAYEEGSGSIKVRGTWKEGETGRTAKTVVIDSIPYGVNKATLLERMATVVTDRKLPQLLDVRDLSTEGVHIELELKPEADAGRVLAYLYRHTPLEVNYSLNLTCLVPTSNPEVGRPLRLNLKEILSHFLDFRLEVVTRKLRHELAQLRKRLHILEGFDLVFDALDEIIAIIRASQGKKDAAEKIQERFPLDAEQTDAILELKLYRLAQLEILVIQEELEKKRARAGEVERLLGDDDARWRIVRDELQALRKEVAGRPENARRTVIEEVAEPIELSEEEFLVDEDAVVVLTRDGWVKRQQSIRDLSKTKMRQGDEIAVCEAGSIKATMVFFSDRGVAYTSRIVDLPATTGHGEPIQKRFKLGDKERIVAAFSYDDRRLGGIAEVEEREAPFVHGLAVSSDGQALRFSLAPFKEPSTRSGRRFARPGEGARIVGVQQCSGDEHVLAVSRRGRAMVCATEEVNYLGGPGKGVRLMKIGEEDAVLGFLVARRDRDALVAVNSRGTELRVSLGKYAPIPRAGSGHVLLKQGAIQGIKSEPPTEPPVLE